jgi:flagellar biosynthesis protein FlhF
MLVRRFYADTSHEALRLVRRSLGPDAMILSNRRAGNGVEIMAVGPDEIETVTEAVALPRRVAAAPVPASRPALGPVPGGDTDRRSGPAEVDARGGQMLRNQPAVAPPARATAPAGASRVAAAAAGSGPGGAAEPGRYELVHEVRLLRCLLEGQLAAFAWSDLKRRDPARGEVMRRLLAAGFGAQLARGMIDELPDGLPLASALRLTKTRLQQRLRVVTPGAGLVDGGGILALVGPTGVGKTTTVAKLAAQCAVKHGAARLALVTTDTYRIGAVDQLRIYGSILRVPVFAIRNEADLRATLHELRTRHLVLIDTVGMSQRDRRLADQVALLSGTARRVQRVLLLSAVAQASVLDDVVRAYRGADLAGCILTKIDEALTLGAALDALIRHQLPLHYVANGQRVPEDLHRPNPLYLVERAFRDGAQAAVLDDGDVPATLAAGQI